jgi:hypothetical protein
LKERKETIEYVNRHLHYTKKLMSPIRKSLILIIYTIHSIFSLWWGFLWHHETESKKIPHSTENVQESQKTCNPSIINSCMSLCLSREYGLQNNKYIETPWIEPPAENRKYAFTANSRESKTTYKIHNKNNIPLIKEKRLVGITKIII